MLFSLDLSNYLYIDVYKFIGFVFTLNSKLTEARVHMILNHLYLADTHSKIILLTTHTQQQCAQKNKNKKKKKKK